MRLGDIFLILLYRLVPSRYYSWASGKIKPARTLVDVGGARGRLSEHLKDKFEIQLILDVLPQHFPKKKTIPSLEYVAASACFLPVRADSVDAVVFHDSLHHLDSPSEGLREALRVLKEGGNLYVFDFDRESPVGRLVRAFERMLGFPARLLTVSELTSLLGEHGKIEALSSTYGVFYAVFMKEHLTNA
ncbi:class I SAM-dependent methyltransferase [Infirmifilum uzonense]|uniref:class I SAM-dependent methyltransferase n=1 Tax=Infirmifilum uzonense TaxID=1550241 RepID=UPI00069C3FA5|nr:class I SAM-dependent methyltransferase [Infirmifilum uzonense]